MRAPQDVLLAWLRFLDEKRFDHCLLRSLEGAATTECPYGIEVAVARAALPELPKLVHAFCLREELLLVQCLHVEEETWRYVLGWHLEQSGAPEFLCIDLIGDYYFAGRRLLSSESMQAMRVETVTADPGQRIQVVGPSIEFLHRLLRCVSSDVCAIADIRRLRALWQSDAAGTANLLSRLWPHEGSALIAAAACDRWDSLFDKLQHLRRALRPKGLAALSAWWRRCRRQWRCMREPTGLFVACLGPDGSGKSQLIAALKERPPQPFEHVYTMRMRPRLARAGLVVSDRYYDDVLVDPRRYRLRRRYGLARALVPWIPRPDLWLVLDAPAEVLKDRKREVTEEESARLRAEYRRVLRGKDNLVLLDASRSHADVLAEAQRRSSSTWRNGPARGWECRRRRRAIRGARAFCCSSAGIACRCSVAWCVPSSTARSIAICRPTSTCRTRMGWWCIRLPSSATA